MFKGYDFLLLVLFAAVHNSWAMEDQNLVSADLSNRGVALFETDEDPKVQQKLDEIYGKIGEQQEQYSAIMKNKAAREERKKSRQLKRLNSVANASRSNDSSVEQLNNSRKMFDSKYLNFETVCVAFIAILFGLKKLFHYCTNESRENIS